MPVGSCRPSRIPSGEHNRLRGGGDSALSRKFDLSFPSDWVRLTVAATGAGLRSGEVDGAVRRDQAPGRCTRIYDSGHLGPVHARELHRGATASAHDRGMAAVLGPVAEAAPVAGEL